MRRYPYVGPAHVLERVAGMEPGAPVRSAADARAWLDRRRSTGEIATFTVGPDGVLRLADRASEHVACAGFLPVLAAGELLLERSGASAEVTWVTNQSTGFCPEPGSWAAVDRALADAGIPHPTSFSVAYEFRRCARCATINIVKDGELTCGCGALLPEEWNLG